MFVITHHDIGRKVKHRNGAVRTITDVMDDGLFPVMVEDGDYLEVFTIFGDAEWNNSPEDIVTFVT